jgi:hypothetical protein
MDDTEFGFTPGTVLHNNIIFSYIKTTNLGSSARQVLREFIWISIMTDQIKFLK